MNNKPNLPEIADMVRNILDMITEHKRIIISISAGIFIGYIVWKALKPQKEVQNA